MLALTTSCNRPDLLEITLKSFYKKNPYVIDMVIHEDSKEGLDNRTRLPNYYNTFLRLTNGMGQHKSIEVFLQENKDKYQGRYYVHLEDDWEFSNSYDWISDSVSIMEQDQSIIKVLAREGSPHPCEHDQMLVYGNTPTRKYGYLKPWTGSDGIEWSGFSWNPGVTRMDLLKQFAPFPKYEQELAEKIYLAGYKVVELADPVYKHIGEGRSTH